MHDQHLLEEAVDDGCKLLGGRGGRVEITACQCWTCGFERLGEHLLGVILEEREIPGRQSRLVARACRADVDLVDYREAFGLEGV